MTLWSYVRSTDISYLRNIDMKLNEYLTTILLGQIMGKADYDAVLSEAEANRIYDNNLIHLPRIYCKDGFNISIQIHNGNYATSENGYRRFGINWKNVEWGYPSKTLPRPDRYCHETPGTAETVGVNCPIEVMDELLTSHGGIDLEHTITEFFKKNARQC